MSEIYWITRLDYLQGILITISVLSGIALFVCLLTLLLYDKNTNDFKKGFSGFKISLPLFLLSIILVCLTPSTKEALLIYGVGGTIDYVKNNKKTKELPDKCIDALTRYVDSIGKEGSK